VSATSDDWPARVFHTRRGRHRRACHNVDEVEAFFADRGFTVLAPEGHDLGEQVQLARHAEVVAGFGGSGMYQVGFTREPTKVIAIATEAYPANNEHLMAALLGHDLHLVVCTPDVRRPDPSKFSAEAYASGFTFDLDVDGAAVDAALAG
jgi:capsular polysaccharide biosynthesis protein